MQKARNKQSSRDLSAQLRWVDEDDGGGMVVVVMVSLSPYMTGKGHFGRNGTSSNSVSWSHVQVPVQLATKARPRRCERAGSPAYDGGAMLQGRPSRHQDRCSVHEDYPLPLCNTAVRG